MHPSLTLTRSLTTAIARAEAPSTNVTPDPNAVLLASMADALRTLQVIVARLEKRVSYLESV